MRSKLAKAVRSMLAGVALGAAAVNALHAQRKTSGALVFLDIVEVFDGNTTKAGWIVGGGPNTQLVSQGRRSLASFRESVPPALSSRGQALLPSP